MSLPCKYVGPIFDDQNAFDISCLSYFCCTMFIGGAVQPPLMQINQKWFDKLIAFGLKLH